MNHRNSAFYWSAALAVFAFTLVCSTSVQAQTFSVIHNFTGAGDGASPTAGLIVDASGNLYGTTQDGGAHGYGTVFKLAHQGAGWVLSTLYSFAGGSDGANPNAKVIFGPDGNLYGTTYYGGGTGCITSTGSGCGTVFNLRPPATVCKTTLCPWTETVLYRFTGGNDGALPEGDLIFDQAGNLYGTTCSGGQVGGNGEDAGVVYRLTPSMSGWAETVVHSFEGLTEGEQPTGGVIFDGDGNLYGTTSGSDDRMNGTVFELIPAGADWTEIVLHTFEQGDGAFTYAGLIADGRGNLYGASSLGGVIFELTHSNGSWTYTALYGCNGMGPYRSLVLDGAGNLYGTAYSCGAYGYGSVFKLTPTGGGWVYTSLHDFNGGSNGGNPESSVVFDTSGNLYGTASQGGANGDGVVWTITP